ncbi:MAG: hypothetical protein Q7S22_04470 [Candidatus Micrarchaeota archaeon]|nr:hypothetical protein [Candidatus Micrarchaeota archaeon]
MKLKDLKIRNYLPSRAQIITGLVVAGLLTVANMSEKNDLRRERNKFKDRAGLLEDDLKMMKSRVALGARNMAVAGLVYSKLEQGFVNNCQEDETIVLNISTKECKDGIPDIIVPTPFCSNSSQIPLDELMYLYAGGLAQVSGDLKIIEFVETVKPRKTDNDKVEQCVAPENDLRVTPRIEVHVHPFGILVPGNPGEIPEDCEPEAQRQPEGRTL